MDRKYVLTSLVYAVIGISLGLFMGATQNHSERITHAHLMLAGFVVSFIYALCHKLWLNNSKSGLAIVQFYLHQIGVASFCLALFLLYGNFVDAETLDPMLGLSSIALLLGMILMVVMFLRSSRGA